MAVGSASRRRHRGPGWNEHGALALQSAEDARDHVLKITQFSLRNPLVVTVITIAIACFGLYAYLTMGVGVTPNISFPSVAITTTEAGADSATVETQITKPIEDAAATLSNVDSIISTSSEGRSTVVVQFTTAANTNLVSVDVERVVNAVRSRLPADADSPSINKFETSAFPVITVAASGPQSLDQLQRIASDRIERAFEAVPGVQSVSISGGRQREIQVKVDLSKLQAYGIGLLSVQQALQSEQIQVPAGLITAAGKDTNVRINALVSQPSQLSDLIVTNTPKGPIYLRDVATVEDGIKTGQIINRVNGVPAVTITATKTANANTLAVSRGVRQVITELGPSLPQGMKLDVVTDAATYTQQSFDTVRKTLLEAIFLTGLILLIFLHTWRSTLIVLVAIPTSVLTTMALMPLAGMNLNLFSMLALTLSVGILVDDSIVVLENVYRHLGLGQPPVLAAITGRSEIGLAALTITMVDVVVYLPIALIAGVAGDFFRPFALVIAFATLTSLLVSFTLTPMLASRFLNRAEAAKQGRGLMLAFGRVWDRGFDRLNSGYRIVINFVLRRKLLGIGMRWFVVLFGLATFAFGISLFVTGRIGIDIFPSGDQNEVDITLTMPPATALTTTDAVVKDIESKLRSVPEVRVVFTNSGTANGGFGISGGDTSRITVLLVPGTQRTRSATQLADEFRQQVDPHVIGSRFGVSLANVFGFGGFGGQPIQVAVRGPHADVLNALVDQITATIKLVPGAVEVNNANEKVQPEYVVQVDRRRAADMGVTAQAAANTLRIAINGSVAAKYRQPGQDDIDIRVTTTDAFRARPDNLDDLPLVSSSGSMVRLGQIGTISRGSAPTQITHFNRERSVTINASASGATVGTVQQALQARLAAITLPPGYSITYAGQAAMGGSAFGDVFRALGIAIVMMYLLMVLLFGSLTLPLAVLMSLPLAVVGALGAMALTQTPFTLFSLLGFAVLVGLVGKNAILLVDYTDTLRKRGFNRTEALLEAGPTRLRPIVMTTTSIFAGLAPVGLGLEAGSELLRAAAIVLIGGLLTSTLLTLIFVPAMYTIFDDIESFVVRMVQRIARPRPMEPEEDAILHPERTPVQRTTDVLSLSAPTSAHNGVNKEFALGASRGIGDGQ